jgi:AraC family transcriptional regulator
MALSQLPRGTSRFTAAAASVKFVLDGEGIYEIDGRTRRLRRGEFMLVEAGREVTVHMPQARTTGLCVHFEPSHMNAQDVLSAPALLGSADEPLTELLTRYTRLLAARPDDGQALSRHILREVGERTDAFLCDFKSRLERLSSVKLSTRIETLQRLERARSFIHEHRGRALTLDEIAGHAALSRFHLTRSFAEAYGAPPLLYHRTLRLAAAAERIRAGWTSPTQAAAELGYASLSAFTRAFRHRFGMPPSELKRVA